MSSSPTIEPSIPTLDLSLCTSQLIIINKRYKLISRLGGGAFGELYLSYDNILNINVALKFESLITKNSQLPYEYKLYKIFAGQIGIPIVYWLGKEGNFNIMALELLGPSLESLLLICKRKFTLKTTLMIIDQMLTRIEYIHSKDFIHRDIKPDNFLIGINKKSHIIYAIDFGLSKKYRDTKTHQHLPYGENKSLTGTARYASLNAHLGIVQSRRDDLESLGFVFIYFLRGNLPWQGLKNNKNKKSKQDLIKDRKLNMQIESICKGYPIEFTNFLNYSRSLRFDDKPDYNYIKKQFRDLFNRERFESDGIFDWSMINYQVEILKNVAEVSEDDAPFDEEEQTLQIPSNLKSLKNPILTTILSEKLNENLKVSLVANSPVTKSLLTSILKAPKQSSIEPPSAKDSDATSYKFELDNFNISRKSSINNTDLSMNRAPSLSTKTIPSLNNITQSDDICKADKFSKDKSEMKPTPKSTLLAVLGAPNADVKPVTSIDVKPKPVLPKKSSLAPPIALLSPTEQQHAIIVAYPSKNRGSLDVMSFTPGLKIPTSDIQREPPKGFFYYCCNCVK